LEQHLFCHPLQLHPNQIEVHKEGINFLQPQCLELNNSSNNNNLAYPNPKVQAKAMMLIGMLSLTVSWQALPPMVLDLPPTAFNILKLVKCLAMFINKIWVLLVDNNNKSNSHPLLPLHPCQWEWFLH